MSITEGIAYYLSFVAAITFVAMAILLVSHAMDKKMTETICADCGRQLGKDDGPAEGWELEDGRVVCHACCVADTRRIVGYATKENRTPDQ